MMTRVMPLAGLWLAIGLTVAVPAAAEGTDRWEGWIVGEPCAGRLQIGDCPLQFIDRPVLLLEDGRHLAFLHGEKGSVKDADVDAAYGRKVRLQGALKDGVIAPVRMDVLEVVGEKKFFKGCL